MSTEKPDPAGWDGESRWVFCSSWQSLPSPPYADASKKTRVGGVAVKREGREREDGKYKRD